MPRAKKTTVKKTIKKMGSASQSALVSAKAKWKFAAAQNKMLKKELSAKLAEKAAEFKNKLKEIEHVAYEKAIASIEAVINKKEAAKKKAMAAAEDKFEKQYAKKFGGKIKKAKKTIMPTAKKTAVKKNSDKKPSTGKRGRPKIVKEETPETTL